MRTGLLCVLISVCVQLHAQRECASKAYLDQQLIVQAELSNTIRVIENFLSNQQSATSRVSDHSVIRIPVVVHVLYKSSGQNISDEQVRSGIEALNRDFRRLNADTSNTPMQFKGLAADVGIEFVLATADPFGRTTNGIIRKQTQVSQWTFDDKIKFASSGGSDAWDSKSYLNIWIGYMPNLLGYSSIPGSAPERDGVVITPAAFGTIGVSGAYSLGRTAVHEVGHWLGLNHIWGDTYCGDDNVSDTPPQSTYTVGCPTGTRISCGNNGNMYMNYMDFADDACMNLFTIGQKLRMRTLFDPAGPRNPLLTSKGLNQPWVEDIPLPVDTAVKTYDISIYPVPARSSVTLDTKSNQDLLGKDYMIYNTHGIMVYKGIIRSSQEVLKINSLPSGLYFMQIAGTTGRYKFLKL